MRTPCGRTARASFQNGSQARIFLFLFLFPERQRQVMRGDARSESGSNIL
jgi:hypothetical protein